MQIHCQYIEYNKKIIMLMIKPRAITVNVLHSMMVDAVMESWYVLYSLSVREQLRSWLNYFVILLFTGDIIFDL